MTHAVCTQELPAFTSSRERQSQTFDMPTISACSAESGGGGGGAFLAIEKNQGSSQVYLELNFVFLKEQ